MRSKRYPISLFSLSVILALFVSPLSRSSDEPIVPPVRPIAELGVQPETQKNIVWKESLQEAFKVARKTSRLVLVDFEAEWCGWCKKLDRDTYGHEEVIQFVGENFIAIKVDVDRHPDSMKKFKISGLPTILFLDPSAPQNVSDSNANEDVDRYQELGRIEGFRPPELFLVEAKKVALGGNSLTELRDAVKEHPQDPDALRAYSRALLAGGKPEEAFSVLEAAVKVIPNHFGLHFEFAEVCRFKRDYEKAMTLYKKILANKDSTNEVKDQVYLPLARCLITLKNFKEAESVLGGFLDRIPSILAMVATRAEPEEKAEENSPDQAYEPKLEAKLLESLFLRAYVRAVLDKPAEALEDLRIVRDADPQGAWGFRGAFIITRLEL